MTQEPETPQARCFDWDDCRRANLRITTKAPVDYLFPCYVVDRGVREGLPLRPKFTRDAAEIARLVERNQDAEILIETSLVWYEALEGQKVTVGDLAPRIRWGSAFRLECLEALETEKRRATERGAMSYLQAVLQDWFSVPFEKVFFRSYGVAYGLFFDPYCIRLPISCTVAEQRLIATVAQEGLDHLFLRYRLTSVQWFPPPLRVRDVGDCPAVLEVAG